MLGLGSFLAAMGKLQRSAEVSGLSEVDLLGLIDLREQIGSRAHRFGIAQHQEAARSQRVVEHRENLALQHWAEVDQHVAAQNQIEVRKGRIDDHVLAREHTHVPDWFLHLVVAIRFDEETPQALRRYILHDVLRVNARSRSGDALFANIRRKDLRRAVHPALVEKFRQAHGQ